MLAKTDATIEDAILCARWLLVIATPSKTLEQAHHTTSHFSPPTGCSNNLHEMIETGDGRSVLLMLCELWQVSCLHAIKRLARPEDKIASNKFARWWIVLDFIALTSIVPRLHAFSIAECVCVWSNAQIYLYKHCSYFVVVFQPLFNRLTRVSFTCSSTLNWNTQRSLARPSVALFTFLSQIFHLFRVEIWSRRARRRRSHNLFFSRTVRLSREWSHLGSMGVVASNVWTCT